MSGDRLEIGGLRLGAAREGIELVAEPADLIGNVVCLLPRDALRERRRPSRALLSATAKSARPTWFERSSPISRRQRRDLGRQSLDLPRLRPGGEIVPHIDDLAAEEIDDRAVDAVFGEPIDLALDAFDLRRGSWTWMPCVSSSERSATCPCRVAMAPTSVSTAVPDGRFSRSCERLWRLPSRQSISSRVASAARAARRSSICDADGVDRRSPWRRERLIETIGQSGDVRSQSHQGVGKGRQDPDRILDGKFDPGRRALRHDAAFHRVEAILERRQGVRHGGGHAILGVGRVARRIRRAAPRPSRSTERRTSTAPAVHSVSARIGGSTEFRATFAIRSMMSSKSSPGRRLAGRREAWRASRSARIPPTQSSRRRPALRAAASAALRVSGSRSSRFARTGRLMAAPAGDGVPTAVWPHAKLPSRRQAIPKRRGARRSGINRPTRQLSPSVVKKPLRWRHLPRCAARRSRRVPFRLSSHGKGALP